MNNVKDRKQLLIRRLILLLVDSISVIVAFYGALALYFNGPIESRFIQGSLPLAMILLVISLGLFAVLKLYTSLWQFASVSELMNIVIATAMSTVVNVIICEAFGFSPPESTYFIYFMVVTMIVGGTRFGYRFLRLYASRHHLFGRTDEHNTRVMVIGAGSAGEKILRETLVSKSLNKDIVCFIDDDPNKLGRTIHGIPVVGNSLSLIHI